MLDDTVKENKENKDLKQFVAKKLRFAPARDGDSLANKILMGF